MTKIAVTGSNGRMGRALIRAVKLNPNVSQGSILNRGDDIKQALNDFDILVDFTRPEATLRYLLSSATVDTLKFLNSSAEITSTGEASSSLDLIYEATEMISSTS